MAMKNSEVASALFRGLVEHAVGGMLVLEETDTELNVIFANRVALECLELQTTADLRIDDLFPSASRVGPYTVFSREIMSRDGLTPEMMMRKSNHHYFLASVGVKRLEIEGQSMVLISFRDITIEKKLARDLQAKQVELERAYAELIEQNNQLKMLDQAKDKFIALTTHELRTPLAAILATSDFLELKLYESDEQRDEFIRTISEQGRHLMDLVNDVLDFAKIRAGKMEFFVEQIDIRGLLEKLSANFGHMAESENIRIHTSFEDGPKYVWADLLRLKEIVNNVMSNAIKYNRVNGEVSLQLVHHQDGQGRACARVIVEDTGVGIPADKHESVFNEFETLEQVSRHHKGTGLGMPISRRLVESMGGSLTFDSEVGVGSKFYIDLPVDKVLAEDMYRSRPTGDVDFAA